jgi:probable F420-dependent oxidoreductase
MAGARAADEAGFGGVACADHIAFGEHLEAYARPELGGSADGFRSTGSDGPWLEPLTVLATLIPITKNVRLTTNILLAALRPPVLLAKMAATLDVLSGGRLELGVGIGWQREEYDAVGLDFRRRGEILDQCLEVCGRLWRDDVTDHVSGPLTLSRLHAMPKPVQPGGVPFWVSGTSNDRVLRRVVRFGTGWSTWGPDAADPAPGIRRMRQALADAGRDPASLGVRVLLQFDHDRPDASTIVERACRLVDLGVTQIVFRVPVTDSFDENLERLAPIAADFRRAVGLG